MKEKKHHHKNSVNKAVKKTKYYTRIINHTPNTQFRCRNIPGKQLLDKLRVIILFKEDYSTSLLLFITKKIFLNAVLSKNQQQGGSGRKTTDGAVITVTTFETCILQRI